MELHWYVEEEKSFEFVYESVDLLDYQCECGRNQLKIILKESKKS